ncbi:hypothetical protein CCGE525_37760 (plasmid) [Rhizobium jaguaris]|uniref:Uncharacterized protein n=1 Tax=Rhizobium jaguaris TaxID=1312183 RepID=A0A387G1P2_9HYPH|nr:hypothetical protein CCGE525_37760 [Rhizobium jaguaris]
MSKLKDGFHLYLKLLLGSYVLFMTCKDLIEVAVGVVRPLRWLSRVVCKDDIGVLFPGSITRLPRSGVSSFNL